MSAPGADALDFLPLFPDDDEEAILERMRAWANEGLDPATDVEEWVDTREGSHWFVSVMPAVREMARLYDLAGTEVPAAAFPVWAWADYLDDHAQVMDLVRLPATRASGAAKFSGPAATVIDVGTRVGVEPASPDDDPPEYEVTTGGTIPAAAAAPAGISATVQAGGALAFSTTYRYVVTALDAAGETVASAEVNGAIAASGANRQILVDWADVPTATSYRVYRKVGVAGPPYDLLATVTASTYTDTGAVVPNGAVHPPAANTTGGAIILPIQAVDAGVAGNVGPGAVTQVVTVLSGVTVTNAAALPGGTEPEPDELLRERVLAAFAGQGAGNKRDYERWARAWEGVGRVTVIPLWNGPGTVKVVVTDSNGDPLPAQTVADLQADLDPTAGLAEGRAPVGAVVTVATAVALVMTVGANVEPEPGYTLDGTGGTISIRGDIIASLRDYIERVPSGGEVVFEKVKGAISTTTGVHDIAAVTLNGAAVNVNVTTAQAPQLADAGVTLVAI